MALIKCNECGREISDQAECCVHCGYKLKKESNSQNVIIEKTNSVRTGSILAIIGSSLLIGFVLIVLLALYMPSTENKDKTNTSTDDIDITIIIGEENGEIDSKILISYLVGICIVDIIILVLGIVNIKGLIPKRYMLIYGIIMLILSMMLSAMMILAVTNCCLLFLYVTPICCFIGSINIIVGALKGKKDEQMV